MATMVNTELSSGLLLVDKPRGVTSFDVVSAVRGALHIKKVGHAGTLDPMATGLLVIGFGHATRLLNAIVEHSKTYEATIRLGLTTDTDDAESERCKRGTESVEDLTDGHIEATIAKRFLGRIKQVPNRFSAIKINGKRAYDLARDGKEVELESRPVTIDEFAILKARRGWAHMDEPSSALSQVAVADELVPVIDLDVRVSCSSGTYIRALARDLGEALGIGGYLTRLRRTRVGHFTLPDDASGRAIVHEGVRHVVAAHTEAKTIVNRQSEIIIRNRAILDIPGKTGAERGEWLRAHALNMLTAAQDSMPTMPISADEAVELRFGRRIGRSLEGDAVAYVPAQTDMPADVVAIVTAANAHQAKPVTVFPAM